MAFFTDFIFHAEGYYDAILFVNAVMTLFLRLIRAPALSNL